MNFDIGPGSNIFDYLVFFNDYDDMYVVFMQKTGRLILFYVKDTITYSEKIANYVLDLSETAYLIAGLWNSVGRRIITITLNQASGVYTLR